MIDPMSLVADLPNAEPAGDRADRIRARCHAALARADRHVPRWQIDGAAVWAPLLGSVGVLYLEESIRLALRLSGLL